MQGKVAWVTGGTRGIGKAITLELARNSGMKVFATYVSDEASALEAAADWRAQGLEVEIQECDVTSRKQVKALCDRIASRHGQLDVLVNNAGINKPTDFDQILDEDWDRILAVNLKGPFICTQEALQLLKKSTCPSIINIGSVSGQYGGPRTAHYAASKAGLISLGQVVARFAAQWGIRCNTVAAGFVESEMAAGALGSSSVAKQADAVLLGRFGSPREIARVVEFLAGEQSSYITAQTINVNGGLYF